MEEEKTRRVNLKTIQNHESWHHQKLIQDHDLSIVSYAKQQWLTLWHGSLQLSVDLLKLKKLAPIIIYSSKKQIVSWPSWIARKFHLWDDGSIPHLDISFFKSIYYWENKFLHWSFLSLMSWTVDWNNSR